MDYKNECVYYKVCIDKGCPCKLVHDVAVNDKAYKALLEEQEQEHSGAGSPHGLPDCKGYMPGSCKG